MEEKRDLDPKIVAVGAFQITPRLGKTMEDPQFDGTVIEPPSETPWHLE